MKNRIMWVDYLKSLAIIGVMGIHCSSVMLDKNLFTLSWVESVFCSSLFRFAIILFVMASGYLLLRKTQPITTIPRRLRRILIPFLFWFIICALIKVIFTNALGTSWTLTELLSYIVNGFLNPLNIAVQFWYVYMILGLYLLSPIISRWIQNASMNEIEYFLLLWVLISLLQFTSIDTVILDYLRYCTGSIGYFVLGYYLTIKKHELLTNKRFGILLFTLGTLITVIGTIVLSYMTASQSLFFIRLGDITPGACLQAIGLFIIIKNIDYSKMDMKINNMVIRISRDSYGIYLVNILVLNFMQKIHIINFTRHAPLSLLFAMILVLAISMIIVEIFYKIPLLRPFSGKG